MNVEPPLLGPIRLACIFLQAQELKNWIIIIIIISLCPFYLNACSSHPAENTCRLC